MVDYWSALNDHPQHSHDLFACTNYTESIPQTQLGIHLGPVLTFHLLINGRRAVALLHRAKTHTIRK